ncbi:MAG: leucine-rich repeat protein [Lachnospiraceae bacterium]
MSQSLSTPQGNLFYEIHSGRISILSYEGTDHYLEIPDNIEDCPVTRIAPKAFLGNRQIRQLVLPSQIAEVGDWAFSHMTGLEYLTLPPREITLGRQVFLDCPVLTEIRIQGQFEKSPELSSYLAAALMILKNPFLFRPSDAGKDFWYAEFDAALCRFLERPDDEGFEPVYLGWFEDEDVMATQHPGYIKQKRLEKAALSMKRLRFPNALNNDVSKLYESYLRSHFSTGVWECFCTKEFASDCAYLKILLDLGCVTEANMDSLLADVNRIGACEAAVMLLQYQQTHLTKSDFFSDLTL